MGNIYGRTGSPDCTSELTPWPFRREQDRPVRRASRSIRPLVKQSTTATTRNTPQNTHMPNPTQSRPTSITTQPI